MNILVTGGAGYIGSHTCVALLEAGHAVTVADNLYNSSAETLERVKQIANGDMTFYQVDVTDESAVDRLFKSHEFGGVMHFAGLKAVSESVANPLAYYYNNVAGTIILAKACQNYHVNRFVFSSSATVYGENAVPFVETMELLPTANPYGATKAMSERILSDAAKANPAFAVSLLRYFNPAGAHESGLIGEAQAKAWKEASRSLQVTAPSSLETWIDSQGFIRQQKAQLRFTLKEGGAVHAIQWTHRIDAVNQPQTFEKETPKLLKNTDEILRLLPKASPN